MLKVKPKALKPIPARINCAINELAKYCRECGYEQVIISRSNNAWFRLTDILEDNSTLGKKVIAGMKAAAKKARMKLKTGA